MKKQQIFRLHLSGVQLVNLGSKFIPGTSMHSLIPYGAT